MRTRKILIGIVLVFFLTIGLKFTSAFFSDAGQSQNNTFAAADTFPTPTLAVTPTPSPSPTPAVIIVINEISSGGDSKDEWVELYNPTDSPINVSGWKISDKNAFDSGGDDTFPTTPSIPSLGYAVVITNNSTVAGIPSSAITIELVNANIGSGLNNTGDAVHLKNALNVVVDSMSYGNETSVFPIPPTTPSSSQSLARSPNGTDTNSASDWIIDTTPSLGISN
ncbi:hypothetical protein A2690_02310 [Candidatus Roizmanbacteria bacterium RIFCSPHIGHO2_01_FULL_39_12b]|uniref:LTD domain-containing protein n=1 Tax=Candidatus Roizmanbacteria bacterium RIFCSPHIGHO2_01_FULL_39_12b TaxID=1802030 RepID=A0A1F7GDQ0_9BACT|nr:MAG: hypothetical protein A2690_02310 [Candidatus Roizmanbacteria bacterium RIFCSPHIGHO2_01_FULL_39_12b]